MHREETSAVGLIKVSSFREHQRVFQSVLSSPAALAKSMSHLCYISVFVNMLRN